MRAAGRGRAARGPAGVAELTSQPAELRGEEPDLTDETFRFGYGDAEIEAEWQHAPDEIRDLGRLLLDIFHAQAEDGS